MNLLPLDQLGFHEKSNNIVKFGLLLPNISKVNGYNLYVKIIKEEDQFQQEIEPHCFPLTHSTINEYGDYWSGDVTIDKNKRKHNSSRWGHSGKYLYRYMLKNKSTNIEIDWIVDPFGREFGIGGLSAFTLGYKDHKWDDLEYKWKTPNVKDLVVYELMLHEFAFDLKGAKSKLKYLSDLGINCIEIMPISKSFQHISWGFEPIGPMGLDERFGNRKDMQEFVEEAHRLGIAVILDMVYGHVGRNFAYDYVYKKLGVSDKDNIFIGKFGDLNEFGSSVDYKTKFVKDYFFTINHYWLDKYHIDGIRYDCVPNYYDGVTGEGYSNLVYATYKFIKNQNAYEYWQRFFKDEKINIIQCAEQLDKPKEVMWGTYSNCTWQNKSLDAAKDVANGDFGNLYNLGMQLGLDGYPDEIIHNNNDVISKTAMQYLENHDQPRFICNFGTYSIFYNVLKEGKRELWYKMQPYIIGFLLAKGIPMLFQGQEILENYDLQDTQEAGNTIRIGYLRPVRWEKFYSEEGKQIIKLYRSLIKKRIGNEVFRYGTYFFVNDWEEYQSKGVLIFERKHDDKIAIVCLNFSSVDTTIKLKLNIGGNYSEIIDNQEKMTNVMNGNNVSISIPSNYGQVWMKD